MAPNGRNTKECVPPGREISDNPEAFKGWGAGGGAMPGGCASRRGATPRTKTGRTTNPEDDPERNKAGSRAKAKLWRSCGPRLLSREQVEAILAQPPSNPIGFRNRAMLAIICEHAVFAIGLAGMDLADLDLSRYQLLGKPLSAELTEKLQRYLQKGRPALLARPEEQALFPSRVGTRIKPITITKMVGTCAGAGDVGARLLWRSWQIYRQALPDRRLPGF